jgi:hypothetical protein
VSFSTGAVRGVEMPISEKSNLFKWIMNFYKIIVTLSSVLFSTSLLASSKAEREMQKAINQVGEPCHKVTQLFFMGKDREGSLLYSVACSGGENYGVLIKQSGEGKVVACSILDKLAGGRGKPGSCFTKH